MSKKIIQDIVVKKKRPKIPTEKSTFKIPASSSVREPVKTRTSGTSKTSRTGKIVFGIFALFLALVVCAKIVSAFSGAIIKLIPHKENLEVDILLKAGLPAQAGESTFYDMAHETMEIDITKEKSVDATGTEEVSSKASGQIIIYNTYSSQSQSLVANTRFESSDGKIYRIHKKITIPGAKIENGEIIPSSIEATVHADEPGEKYNIGLSDFKIPGFKGGARYEKFYAKSKTPLEGGFIGVLPVISEEKQKKIKEELELSIKDELFQKARLQAPSDYLFYEKAFQINFTEDKNVNNPAETGENLKFTTRETGILLVFLIPRDELTNVLVKKYLGEEFVSKVKVNNLESLDFLLVSHDDSRKLIIFKIKGSAEFVWIIEEDKLKNALIAQPKELEEVFQSFSAIDQASVVFRPFWWKFFPEKASKISIEQVFLR